MAALSAEIRRMEFDAEKLKYGIVSKKMVPKDKRTVVKYAGTEEESFADFNRTNKVTELNS